MSLKTLIKKNAVLVNFIFNIDTKIKQEMLLEDQKKHIRMISDGKKFKIYNILK